MAKKLYTVVTTVPSLFGGSTAVPGDKVVEFDDEGKARVDAETAQYLAGINGFTVEDDLPELEPEDNDEPKAEEDKEPEAKDEPEPEPETKKGKKGK